MKDILKQAEEKMKKSIHVLSDEFAAVRAGRANPAILDKVMVDYYGAPTAINQLAAVSVSEARVLVIQPWDVSSLESIEKAIQVADLGINPQNDGKVIRLTFPQLTEERRREIAKDIGKMCENGKVAIRSIRRDAIEKLNQRMKIPAHFEGIQEKDIPLMAKHAAKEANPLYPVPKLMDAKELEKFYYMVM